MMYVFPGWIPESAWVLALWVSVPMYTPMIFGFLASIIPAAAGAIGSFFGGDDGSEVANTIGQVGSAVSPILNILQGAFGAPEFQDLPPELRERVANENALLELRRQLVNRALGINEGLTGDVASNLEMIGGFDPSIIDTGQLRAGGLDFLGPIAEQFAGIDRSVVARQQGLQNLMSLAGLTQAGNSVVPASNLLGQAQSQFAEGVGSTQAALAGRSQFDQLLDTLRQSTGGIGFGDGGLDDLLAGALAKLSGENDPFAHLGSQLNTALSAGGF